MLLSTKNLRLQGPRKLHDRFVGPFTVLERIGQMAYCLDLTGGRHRQALKGIDDVFHVGLLKPYQNNGMEANAPTIVVNNNKEYKIGMILQHRELKGKTQYLVQWCGYDQSEDM